MTEPELESERPDQWRLWEQRLAWLMVGILVLSGSSYAAIPIGPVPITMQTLAVTLIGALYGWWQGGLTVLAWLVLGALGMPFFSEGESGVEHLVGATAGYLWAFPIAAAVTGALVARGWNIDRKAWAFAAMLLGNLICLSFGAAWLAGQIGLARAFEVGFAPFLVGAAIKSALGVGVLMLVARLRSRGADEAPAG